MVDFEELPNRALLSVMEYLCGNDRFCWWYEHQNFYIDVRNFIIAALARRIWTLKVDPRFRLMYHEAWNKRLEDQLERMLDAQWNSYHG